MLHSKFSKGFAKGVTAGLALICFLGGLFLALDFENQNQGKSGSESLIGPPYNHESNSQTNDIRDRWSHPWPFPGRLRYNLGNEGAIA